MADDLSLLLKIQGDASSAKTAVGETRTAIASLRQNISGEFANMEKAATGVFDELGKHINVFVGERIPLLGGAFIKVTENVKDLGAEAENAEGSLAALGGAGGVATLAITALGAAAVGAGVAIFEMVEKSAEGALELEHLTEKTGLSAKTITSLKFAFDELGQSIEGFDVGMKLFANTVAQAALGSDQAAEKLKRLGVTPKEALVDLNATLEKVFKAIYDAPPGIEKMSLAADAFGRRMGANMIPVIEAFHGDLKALIERAEELGVTLDDEGVKSLAEFQTSMNELKKVAAGLERLFAVELAPTLTSFLQDLTKSIETNREAIVSWGDTIADVFRGARRIAESELGQMAGEISAFSLKYGTGLGLIFQGLQYAGQPAASSSGLSQYTNRFLNRVPSSGAAATRALFGTRGALGTALDTEDAGGGGGKTSREKLSEGQKLLNQLTDEYNRLLAKTNDLSKVDVVTMDLLKKEYQDIDPLLRNRIIGEAMMIDTLNESAKAKKDQIQLEKDVNEANEEAARSGVQMLIDKAQKRTDIENELNDALANQSLELEKLRGYEETNLDRVEKENLLLIAQAEALGGVTDRMKELLALRLKVAAQEDAQVAKNKEFEGVSAGAGGGILPTGFEGLFKQLNDTLSGDKLTAAVAGVQAMATAFQSLGEAVGQAVQSFVLLGSTGTSIRKFTAEVIAAVAQQAAIKAVFELAEGFANLALNFFWPDPRYAAAAAAHFHAAAIYGAIAGVTALAGRAVAGNAFANTGGSGSPASSGGAGGTAASSSSSSIILGSQRSAVLHLSIEHSFKKDGTLQSHISDVVVKDISSGNGAIRGAVIKEINRQQ